MLKRGQNADDAVKSGVHVGVAACVVTDFGERSAEMVLDDVGQSRLGLPGGRERRTVAPGRRLSIATQRGINHGRVESAHLLIAESKPVQRPGAKILDDDV